MQTNPQSGYTSQRMREECVCLFCWDYDYEGEEKDGAEHAH